MDRSKILGLPVEKPLLRGQVATVAELQQFEDRLASGNSGHVFLAI
jgi:hypothetical protein